MPNSIARRKSSSSCIASGSPPAALSDCSTSRRRCSTGSLSSEYAGASSTPPMMRSQASTSPGLRPVRLGERLDRGRVVGDEGGLQQVVLDELLVELDDDLGGVPRRAAARRRAGRRSCAAPRRGVSTSTSSPTASDTASRIGRCRHSPSRSISPPRPSGTTVEPSARAASTHDLAGQRRHRPVVAVRLVDLEHRELGAVRGVDALVAEVAADLVDPVQAADDQPLEVELDRDAQVHRLVERVEVRENGRAAAPPCSGCSSGVSTSRKSCRSSVARTDLRTVARLRTICRESALTARST